MLKTFQKYLLVLVLLPLSMSCAGGADIVEKRPDAHPRVIWTKARIAEIKELAKTDKDLQGLIRDLKTLGDAICEVQPVVYKLKGVKRFRLLSVSRAALGRSITLGTLHLLDGDPKYKKRLLAELKSVCSFKDWYPVHFLDTAEMSAAVGIGYDWLYNDISESDRKFIREALIEKGLGVPGALDNWWVAHKNNWNQVCHGSLVVGALALGKEAPELTAKILQSAKDNYKSGVKAYAPQGVYPEGPGYWSYGTAYSVFMASALQTARGDSWGLLDTPGFKESFHYRIQAQTPAGKVVNYSDGGEGSGSTPLFWFMAREMNKGEYAAFALASLKGDRDDINRSEKDSRELFELEPDAKFIRDKYVNRFFALSLAWYTSKRGKADLPRDFFAVGDSDVHLAFMRSAWNDENALFASLKAGEHTVGHGHLDAGTFVIDWGGLRWASEFPSEKQIYDSQGTWKMNQKSFRWAFFRTNNFGHNTLTINNQLQRVKGKSPIIKTSTGNTPFAIADLDKAVATEATGFKRGVSMPGRKYVLVQDELEGVAKGKLIRWNMITEASVVLSKDKKSAILKQEGKTMTVKILSPSKARFSTRDAKGKREDENENEGYSRLIIDLTSDGKPVTIATQFIPGNTKPGKVKLQALKNWAPKK
jgi:hypothetical protein